MKDYNKREGLYRGMDYQDKLAGIVLCGAGAIGSNLCDNLVRCGFRYVRVIDHDVVEEHNISTQIYGEKDIGAKKAIALHKHCYVNMKVVLDAVDRRLEEGNVKHLDRKVHNDKIVDLVVDCFDNAASRQLVKDYCDSRKIPCLHIGLNEDYAEVVWNRQYRVPKDAAMPSCDVPLARNIIQLAVAVASEEILDHYLSEDPRATSWTVTLRDLQVLRRP